METPYDWVTVAFFSALVLLYLQRSAMDNPPDKVWQYLPPAVGCALANWLGNEGHAIPAVLVLVGVIGYTWYVLKPFSALSDPPRP